MERRVLLTFKESRKPATLPPPSTTPDLLIVRECAQSLFTALEKEESHNILVQVYDSEFEEWVDIDHSSVVTAKEKLKIVLDSVQEPTEVRIDEINGKR